MKPKFEKSLLLFFSSAIMALVILFVPNSIPIVGVANSYVLVINSFLAVNVASMLNKTAQMPVGHHHSIRRHRYIMSLLYMLGLSYLSYKLGRSETLSIFSSGSLIIIGLWISGLQGNKIVTDKQIK